MGEISYGLTAPIPPAPKPTRYRKRPVVIEAMQYIGFAENGEAVERWLGDSFNSHLPSVNKVEIQTLEGLITASAGDFIIRGVQGEFYPCKPAIFAATYEPAGAES